MKKIVNKFATVTEAKSANESFARQIVSAFASQLDPTVDALADIKTAVSEAVTNCIVHAYKNERGKIYISASYDEDRVFTVSVKDRGCGIEDVEKAIEPLYTTDSSGERSGMGFAIMASFMDKLTVKSKPGLGTKVVMKKKL